MVLWLEEQKIRRYPVDSSERNGLRNFGSNQWQQFFEKYAKDLQCPDIARETNVQTLCWMLGYALRLEAKYGSERTSDNPLTFLDNIDGKVIMDFYSESEIFDTLYQVFDFPQRPFMALQMNQKT